MNNPYGLGTDCKEPEEAALPVTDLRDYAPFEGLFAWVCVIVGYLFCLAFPPARYPLGMFIVVFIAIVSTFAVLIKKKTRLSVASVVSAVVSLFFAFSFVVNNEPLSAFVAFVCMLVSYCFFVYCATGNRSDTSDADMLPLELFRALNGFSVYGVADMFRIMFMRRSKSLKVLLRIVIGFAAAAIPTAIVISLLSYDGGFSDLLNNAFSFLDDFDFTVHLYSFIFGVIVAMYIFGVYSVNTSNRAPADVGKYRRAAEKIRIAPMLTVAAALLPLAVVYVFFFVSQWQYYVSGFSGVLPEGVVNYAEYARSGFFELCAVSAINLALISAVALFMRREGSGANIFLRAVSVLFSLMTLVLIGTAMAKMALYIDRFGLTKKRVLSSWFMILLAIVFLIVIVRQFVPKFRLFRMSAIAVAAMSALLVMSDYSGIIADYNVEMYVSGKTEAVDIDALNSLGNSAVPAMVRLAEHWEGDIKNADELCELTVYLENAKMRLDKNEGIFAFSLPNDAASEALDGYFGE